ncbi:nucleotidyltransferase domain-containing protein [Sulfurimonas sp. SAG-AH-194-C21]|nr:nucleotidyltransferase domain-containing protein [Sulfurimonas sp. SAG-AH-194-C21]MDF1883964.1 nucleotidyltransferase domain-containing protein [Sulfurimonas sp. SAG-AH-194-C21]
MNSKEEILDFLHRNYATITRKYHLTKLGMFGSFARDEQHIGSDVDIIIEIEDGTENIHDLKNSLRTYLTHSFERSVDIAREKYLKPYVKELILKDTIYVK